MFLNIKLFITLEIIYLISYQSMNHKVQRKTNITDGKKHTVYFSKPITGKYISKLCKASHELKFFFHFGIFKIIELI